MLHSEQTDEILTASEYDLVSAVTASMGDISLLALDIVRNSLEACATEIELTVNETDDSITVMIKDNGKGIEKPADALSILYTSRKTRRVGMGLPIFRAKAEMTGGVFGITSNTGADHGTVVSAVFIKRQGKHSYRAYAGNGSFDRFGPWRFRSAIYTHITRKSRYIGYT